MVSWLHHGWALRKTATISGRGFLRPGAENHFSVRHTQHLGYEIHRQLKRHEIYKIPAQTYTPKLGETFPEYHSPGCWSTKQNVNFQPWQAIFSLIMFKYFYILPQVIPISTGFMTMSRNQFVNRFLTGSGTTSSPPNSCCRIWCMRKVCCSIPRERRIRKRKKRLKTLGMGRSTSLITEIVTKIFYFD